MERFEKSRRGAVRRLAATIMVAGLSWMVAGMAIAATSTTTATVTASVVNPSGTRVLSTLNAISTLTFQNGSRTATASMSATVVETLADGVNNWYVTAIASDFAKVGGGSIGAANMSLGSVSANVTGVGDLNGTPSTSGAGGTLEQARTFFTVTGETPGTFPGYTGTYTGTGTLSLTVPAGTAQGVYTSTVTVTLIN